jgi:hypothetical protein
LVLVCSVAITPDLRDCITMNARVVMRLPEAHAHAVSCALHGQAYLAESAIERHLGKNDRVKIVCVAQEKIDKEIAKLPKR